jgi:hypothetical protein
MRAALTPIERLLVKALVSALAREIRATTTSQAETPHTDKKPTRAA